MGLWTAGSQTPPPSMRLHCLPRRSSQVGPGPGGTPPNKRGALDHSPAPLSRPLLSPSQHFSSLLLQGLSPTQGSNPRVLHLLHWLVDSLPLCHLGRPLQLLQSNQIRFVFLAFWKGHKTMSQKDNEFDSHFYFVMLWTTLVSWNFPSYITFATWTLLQLLTQT